MRSATAIMTACVVCGVLLWSCNTSGCLENRSSVPLAGFYSAETGQAITIDSLAITGIGKEDGTPLYDGKTPYQQAYLPMRSTQDMTAWELACRVYYEVDDERHYGVARDTIAFWYDSSPYFASDECGVIYKYRITEMHYTTHMIQRVEITDSLITNLDTERIKIYYK